MDRAIEFTFLVGAAATAFIAVSYAAKKWPNAPLIKYVA